VRPRSHWPEVHFGQISGHGRPRGRVVHRRSRCSVQDTTALLPSWCARTDPRLGMSARQPPTCDPQSIRESALSHGHRSSVTDATLSDRSCDGRMAVLRIQQPLAGNERFDRRTGGRCGAFARRGVRRLDPAGRLRHHGGERPRLSPVRKRVVSTPIHGVRCHVRRRPCSVGIPVPVWATEVLLACWPKVQCPVCDTSQTLVTPREPQTRGSATFSRRKARRGWWADVQTGSRDMLPLPDEGLVFSLGLSYGRGRASSAPGATTSGPMRRISREA